MGLSGPKTVIFDKWTRNDKLVIRLCDSHQSVLINEVVHIVILFPFNAHINKILHQIPLILYQLIHKPHRIRSVNVLKVLELKFHNKLWILSVRDLVRPHNFLCLLEVVLAEKLSDRVVDQGGNNYFGLGRLRHF
jgi:hypothetical protein